MTEDSPKKAFRSHSLVALLQKIRLIKERLLLLLSLESVQGNLVRSSARLLSLFNRTEIFGECLERFRYRRAFQDVLKQCQETTKNFEGSEETLQHILQVEETLKRLVSELN